MRRQEIEAAAAEWAEAERARRDSLRRGAMDLSDQDALDAYRHEAGGRPDLKPEDPAPYRAWVIHKVRETLAGTYRGAISRRAYPGEPFTREWEREGVR